MKAQEIINELSKHPDWDVVISLDTLIIDDIQNIREGKIVKHSVSETLPSFVLVPSSKTKKDLLKRS